VKKEVAMANRIFVADGREFPDPNPTLTTAEVQKMLADFMPELNNADVIETKRGEDTVYTFNKKVGTKG
jgi:PRTRC genetic system protein C